MAELTLESCGVPPWETLVDIYSEFEERGSEFVTHWKHAAGSAGLERPEPFWLERAGRPAAALLDEPPQDRRGAVRYAFAQFQRVPVLSEFYGADGEVDTVWLRWMINRVDFNMRFSLAGPQPALEDVVVEFADLEERLLEVVVFTDVGRRIHREVYRYDTSGRVNLIELMDGTPSEVESRSVVEVSFDGEGPAFVERGLVAGEEFPAAPEQADERATEPPPPPPAVVDAAAQAVASLSAAIATWCERAPQSGSITRILLLHSWPVNPPFPPALVARSGRWSSDGDPYEFFEPAAELDAWFGTERRELRDFEASATAEILNAWFMDAEPEQAPFDLFVEIAQATRQEIEKRTGRDVWVLPIDHDMTEAGRAVEALLPPDVSGPIVEALRAAEDGE